MEGCPDDEEGGQGASYREEWSASLRAPMVQGTFWTLLGLLRPVGRAQMSWVE